MRGRAQGGPAAEVGGAVGMSFCLVIEPIAVMPLSLPLPTLMPLPLCATRHMGNVLDRAHG